MRKDASKVAGVVEILSKTKGDDPSYRTWYGQTECRPTIIRQLVYVERYEKTKRLCDFKSNLNSVRPNKYRKNYTSISGETTTVKIVLNSYFLAIK